MSKVKDSSREELASESTDSNPAPAIGEMINEGHRAVVSRRRSPEDFDEEDTAKKAKTPKQSPGSDAVPGAIVQGVYADVTINVPKSDRDRSRTVRQARKRLRAARRMERCTEKQGVQRHKTVPEDRFKLLY